MAEVASAFVSLLPSARGFGSKLDSEISGDLDRSGKSGGKMWGAAFAAAGAAVLGGGVALAGFLKDSIGEAREAQKVGAITAQVIKTTGGAANITAQQVGDLAASISNKTGIDDEQIQSASNLLLTFTNLRNEVGKGNDIFNQATQIATDMGAALGNEPKAAAIQLGKALNDPIKGVTALTRVGVSFTEQQKTQIEAMAESGNVLGAQKIILAELNKEFGGAAAASATAGEKAAVAWGNLKEQVGTALLPVIDRVAATFTGKIVPAISGFISGMQSGVGAGGQFAEVMRRIGDTLAAVGGFLSRYRDFLVPMAATILAIVTAVKVWTVAQAALNFVLTANPIGIVVVAIGALVGALVYAWKNSEKFRGIVTGAWNAIRQTTTTVWNAIRSAVTTTVNTLRTAITTTWNTIKNTVTSVWNAVRAATTTVWNTIKATVTTVGNAIKAAVQAAWNAVKAVTSTVWQAVRVAVIAPLQAILAAVRGDTGQAKAIMQGAWNAIKAATSAAWNAIKTAVSTGINNAVAVIRGLPGRARAALGAMSSLLFSAGQDLIQGLINGVKSMVSSLVSAASDVVGSAIDAAKSKLGIQSPSKVFKEIGEFVGKGFIDGVTGTREEVKGTFDELMTLVNKTSNDALKELVATTRTRMLEVASEYDKATAGLEKARERLQALRKEAADYRASVSGAIAGTGDVTGFEGATDAEGNTLPLTFADIAGGLQDAAKRAKAFTQVIRQLKTAGLNQAALDQIVQAGPERGLEAAQAILAEGDAAIAQVNKLQGHIEQSGNRVAKLAADNMYKAGVDSAEALVAGLKGTEAKLEAQMVRMANRMLATLKREFDIGAGAITQPKVNTYASKNDVHTDRGRDGKDGADKIVKTLKEMPKKYKVGERQGRR